MKLELTQGCICDAFEVDGKRIRDLSIDEKKNLLRLLTERIIERQDLSEYQVSRLEYLLMTIVEEFYDTYVCDEDPCECCGDYVETYTLTI